MAKKDFEERVEEIREQFIEEGLNTGGMGKFEDVYNEGFSAIDTGRRRAVSGEIYLPNKRLAAIWRKIFRVQFTDGGWSTIEGRQMEHPFEYSDAAITVRQGGQPLFKSYETHEKMEPPLEHFSGVEFMLDEMVYLVRLMTGDDSYGRDELKEDLRKLENMEFDVASIENCSKCNPNIY